MDGLMIDVMGGRGSVFEGGSRWRYVMVSLADGRKPDGECRSETDRKMRSSIRLLSDLRILKRVMCVCTDLAIANGALPHE